MSWRLRTAATIDYATSAGSRALVHARLDELSCPWLCEIALRHVFPSAVRLRGHRIDSRVAGGTCVQNVMLRHEASATALHGHSRLGWPRPRGAWVRTVDHGRDHAGVHGFRVHVLSDWGARLAACRCRR